MEANKFEMTGKVSFIKFDTFDSGAMKVRFLISKKTKQENVYDTFAITFWNQDAEKFANEIKKGDYVNVTGRLGINRFTDKNGNKREDLELVGQTFVKAVWDEATRNYVIADASPFD